MRPWLELIRLPAVFTAPADVLAGLALAALAGAVLNPLTVALLIVASVCVYCAGMAANDVCDAAIDARERPGRPIPSGRISPRGALAFVLGLQAAGLGVAALVSLTTVLAVGGTIAATWLYNAVLKETPLGPLMMGLCRYGNACIGLSALGTLSAWGLMVIPLTTAAYVTALTFVSRYEVDGATRGQLTAPFAALAIGAILPATWPLVGTLPHLWAAALVLGPLLWVLLPMRAAWAAPGAGPIRGVVMAGIYGIAMVNAVIAIAAGGWWQCLVAVGLLIPGKKVGRWFYAT